MLKTKLLHPEILHALGINGHGAKVLISDGNFPHTTCTFAGARKVFLNFAPDMLSATDVLRVLVDYINVEKATVMLPADNTVPSIHDEFRKILGDGLVLDSTKRFEFYEQTRSNDTCLVIATGERRRFSNILLTIGVVR